jgi:uncharacterized protein YwgA
MTKETLILACLAASDGNSYDPAQIQKLIFLYQEKGLPAADSKPFHFTPYNFGPFDSSVYSTLDALSERGLVEILGQSFSKNRAYRLSAEGEVSGQAALRNAPANQYLRDLSSWVRKLSFTALVSAVYKEFPHMKANSVFRG